MQNKSKTFTPNLPNLKHNIDTRSPQQKLLSTKIIDVLTQQNLQFLRNKYSNPNSTSTSSQLKPYNYTNQYCFVCFTGLPCFQKEFQNLQLPGDIVKITVRGVDKQCTPQEYVEIFWGITLESQADRVAQIISKIPMNKKIVIVFHSFGTFVLGKYINKYGGNRIFGMIEIAGMPITIFGILIHKIGVVEKLEPKQILDNIDSIYQNYLKYFKQNKMSPFTNKYHLLLDLKLLKGQQILQYNRGSPNVLKLLFAAKKDMYFTQDQVNEKLIYYTYYKQPQQAYRLALSKAYYKLNGVKVNNVQERFVINFEDGKHSLHMMPKIVPDMKIAIKEYMAVIDEASKNIEPRL